MLDITLDGPEFSELDRQSDTIAAEPKPKKEEILVPPILSIETMETVTKAYEEAKPEIDDKVILLFDKCQRVESSGLRALSEFGDKVVADGKNVYINNINNTQFKALKLTGKIEAFRFFHRGEYRN
ncbi:MAG: hypothetical protein H7A23_19620 [Leptospiraceae bacterium]|nr:hypothetical protein [Leptospiraceae bacterium]MCP5496765.1 hypothetical protein [Leptospiraceae bacterium]